jgi:hypothetical protein
MLHFDEQPSSRWPTILLSDRSVSLHLTVSSTSKHVSLVSMFGCDVNSGKHHVQGLPGIEIILYSFRTCSAVGSVSRGYKRRLIIPQDPNWRICLPAFTVNLINKFADTVIISLTKSAPYLLSMNELLDVTNTYILQFPVSGNNSVHVPDTTKVYVIWKFIIW